MYFSPCKQVTMEIEPMWTAAFLITAVDFGPARKCDMALVPFVTKKSISNAILNHFPATLPSESLEIA